MKPATDIETNEAVEQFARMSPAEQDAVMARGRQIETIEDLEGLTQAQAERLRLVIEGQSTTP